MYIIYCIKYHLYISLSSVDGSHVPSLSHIHKTIDGFQDGSGVPGPSLSATPLLGQRPGHSQLIFTVVF